jgi:hypothetical protein
MEGGWDGAWLVQAGVRLVLWIIGNRGGAHCAKLLMGLARWLGTMKDFCMALLLTRGWTVSRVKNGI